MIVYRGWTMALAFAAAALLAGAAGAQEITLKVEHFLPPSSPAQTELIEPWAKAVEAQSGGRIKVQIYPAMQLGGKPPQLIDQVRDGIVDVVWTLPSYTPGRFPKMSVFELPFMISDAVATSKAAEMYYETYARDEFADVHPLLFHVHARGLIHTRDKPVRTIADLHNLNLRAPSRQVGDMLAKLGASPVFMPVPQLPEALSKGVVDGAVVPWEVTVSLRLYELTNYHTAIPGPRGLYTAVFLLAMNKDKYEGLPPDLKKVIDDNSGMAIVERIGKAWEAAEKPGLEKAKAHGNTLITMDPSEVAKMRPAAEAVYADWIADLDSRGADGEKLLKAAQDLIDHYTAKN